ncbi:M50 family metallopeptidase [Staphylococcus massiliensis]|uniref:M50 family metallopeptidase n=1 Tax=Staphylococcus massiliensis TaxID=555791 RepID=UPI0002E73342|nr:M50 family metallopeptidase [Staphylococcus massiliensis]MCG3400273.1 M50 family metallopeptidase [Staphylococcus massiliensis]MCG3401903.1 M50 family metallopeptidase [Staphylococcus massiliensis]MCG3412435.1 M50 family metallopeptidase [Staphylococcus massiliensis]PNZ97575.1 hypothetical protein CD133_10400 [Staphylococcus massiliensis CCUG 55927]
MTLENLQTIKIILNPYLITLIIIGYIAIHYYRGHRIFSLIEIILNFIPVLIHEFGHVLMNSITFGKPKDLVVVVRPKERRLTSRQGYAVTTSSNVLTQVITTLGGYIMPSMMLILGIFLAIKDYSVVYIISFLCIFIYYLVITSRKLVPLSITILLIIVIYQSFKYNVYQDFQLVMFIIYHYLIGTLAGEVILSSIRIVRFTFSRSNGNWDGYQLKLATHIPTICFSIIWLTINCFAMYYTFVNLW